MKLVRTDEQGRSLILRIVAPTDWFGERVLAIGGTVRYASAEALEDSGALVWDGSALVQAILTHPKVSRTTLGLLAEAIEAEQARVQDFVSPDVGRRLARLLVRLSQHLGRNTRRGFIIPLSLSRQDLAELVITSPFTVSRILAEWRRLDILDAQRMRIVIRDKKQLAAIWFLEDNLHTPWGQALRERAP